MSKAGTFLAMAVVTLLPAANAARQKAKPAADYFPLRVSDSWSYRNTSGNGGYTLKVLTEEPQPGGSKWYVVELLSGVKIQTLYSKAGGWVLMHAERYPEHEGLEAKYEPPRQYLPNPLVVGAKWDWTGKDYTQTERKENTRVAGFETLTVPAGKFRAVKVVSQITGGGTPMTKRYWYAEGVGLVKSTTEAGQINYGSELVDYSFKKKAK